MGRVLMDGNPSSDTSRDTNDTDRWVYVNTPLRLAVGSHKSGSGKGCAMNLVSWENGDTTITDLPPKWDGHPVEWEGWQSPPPIFFCPPRRPQPCTACGRFGEPVMNHGTATRRGILSLRPGVRSRFRLIAYRCPHCAFDQVWEVDTHKFWDLDYTDYGDEGSRA